MSEDELKELIDYSKTDRHHDDKLYEMALCTDAELIATQDILDRKLIIEWVCKECDNASLENRPIRTFGLDLYILNKAAKTYHLEWYKQHAPDKANKTDTHDAEYWESHSAYYQMYSTFHVKGSDAGWMEEADNAIKECAEFNIANIDGEKTRRKEVIAHYDDGTTTRVLKMTKRAGYPYSVYTGTKLGVQQYKMNDTQKIYAFNNKFDNGHGGTIEIKYDVKNPRCKLTFVVQDADDDNTVNIILESHISRIKNNRLFGINPKDILKSWRDAVANVDKYKAAAMAFKPLSDANICRQEAMEKVCNIRKKEGDFINESLDQMRSFLKYIINEKTKHLMAPAPRFNESCISQYCNKSGMCFNSPQVVKPANPGAIIQCLQKSVDPKRLLEDMTVAVFCMLYLDREVHDPPTVPYIYINDLVVAVESNDKPDVFSKLKQVLTNIEQYDNKTQSIKSTSVYNELRNVNNPDAKALMGNVGALLKIIRKHNAASVIGTIEFTDEMAKMLSINRMCSLDATLKDDKVTFPTGQPYDQYKIVEQSQSGGSSGWINLEGGAHYTTCKGRHKEYAALADMINDMYQRKETVFKASYISNPDGGMPKGEYSGSFVMQHKSSSYRVNLPRQCLSPLFERILYVYVHGKALHIIQHDDDDAKIVAFCESATKLTEKSVKTVMKEMRIS